MNVLLENPLKDYMIRTNQHNILITVMICHTWGGSTLRTSARFVDSREVNILKEKEHFISFPNELGEVLIRRIPEVIDDPVILGLSEHFNMITIKGIHSA